MASRVSLTGRPRLRFLTNEDTTLPIGVELAGPGGSRGPEPKPGKLEAAGRSPLEPPEGPATPGSQLRKLLSGLWPPGPGRVRFGFLTTKRWPVVPAAPGYKGKCTASLHVVLRQLLQLQETGQAMGVDSTAGTDARRRQGPPASHQCRTGKYRYSRACCV